MGLIRLLLLCSVAARAELSILAVGNNRYSDKNLMQLDFANVDASRVGAAITESKLKVDSVIVVATPLSGGRPASQADLRDAIQLALRKTGSGATACLFFSLQGQLTAEGTASLHTPETSIEKPTEVTIDFLQNEIDASIAARIVLFFDVSRQSRINGLDNRIHQRLQRLRRTRSGSLTVLLAAEPLQQSRELKEEKNGVFAYYLSDVLRAARSTQPEKAFRELQQRVLDRTKQQPDGGTGRTGPQRPIWNIHPKDRGRPLLSGMPGPRQSPGLPLIALAPGFASDWFGGLFQLRSPAQTLIGSGLRLYVDQGASSDRPEADRLIAQANRDLTPSESTDLAVELEREARPVVVRYGLGDQFAGDPWLLRREDFERAGRAFYCAARLKRDVPDPDYQKRLDAAGLFCDGRALLFDRAGLSAAETVLQESVSKDPTAPEPRNALGILYLETRRLEPARTQFLEAIARAPLWAYPRHNLALTLIELGRRRAAAQQYREAIGRTPNYPYLHYNLALAELQIGRPKEARTILTRTLEELKQEAGRYDALASAWFKPLDGVAQIQKDTAKNASARAAHLRKTAGQVQNALCVTAERERGRGPGSGCYEKAIQADDTLVAAHHNRALALREEGNARAAIEEWKLVVAKAPTQERARLELARTYAATGETDLAIKQYDILLRLPEHFEAYEGKARLYASRKDWDGAIREMSRAIEAQAKQRTPEGAPLRLASAGYYARLAEYWSHKGNRDEICTQTALASQADPEPAVRKQIKTLRVEARCVERR